MDNKKAADHVIDFDAFLEKNREKICESTPVNPTIAKDDEWLDEKEWDKHYEELKEK